MRRVTSSAKPLSGAGSSFTAISNLTFRWEYREVPGAIKYIRAVRKGSIGDRKEFAKSSNDSEAYQSHWSLYEPKKVRKYYGDSNQPPREASRKTARRNLREDMKAFNTSGNL
jgi:hypothetical protein